MTALHYFLHWYDGALWSNILADVLFAGAGYLWGRRGFKKLHAKLDRATAKQKLMHKHIKEIHRHLGVQPS